MDKHGDKIERTELEYKKGEKPNPSSKAVRDPKAQTTEA